MDPWSGDLQCVKDAGHESPQHVYQGIAWTDADEPMTSLTLTHSELGLAIDGVAPLVQSQDAEAAPLLKKLQAAYKETKR